MGPSPRARLFRVWALKSWLETSAQFAEKFKPDSRGGGAGPDTRAVGEVAWGARLERGI